MSDDAQIGSVILSYFNASYWVNITMNGLGGKLANYTAILPVFPERMVINYRIYANDTQDAWLNSTIFSYTIIDTPPLIANLNLSPEEITTVDSVRVNATVTDGTGVLTVTLFYSFDGVTFTHVEMTLIQGNVYRAEIPAYPVNFPNIQVQSVIFRIEAADVYGNVRVSTTYGYSVLGTLPSFDPLIGLLILVTIPLVIAIIIVLFKIYERY